MLSTLKHPPMHTCVSDSGRAPRVCEGLQMELHEAQDLMRRIYLERDRRRGVERTILRTFQELAELSDAFLKGDDHSSINSELADVLAWVCSLANLLDVDLTQALTKKYGSGCSRCGHTPCECKDTP